MGRIRGAKARLLLLALEDIGLGTAATAPWQQACSACSDLDSIPRTKQIWSCLHLLLKSVYDFDDLKTKHKKRTGQAFKVENAFWGFFCLEILDVGTTGAQG